MEAARGESHGKKKRDTEVATIHLGESDPESQRDADRGDSESENDSDYGEDVTPAESGNAQGRGQ